MSEYRIKVTTDLGDSKQQIASLQKDINVLTGQQTVKINVDPQGLNLDAFKTLQTTLSNIGKTNPFNFEFKQGPQIAQTFKTIQTHSKTTKEVLLQTYKITRDMDGPVRKWDMGLRRIGRSAEAVGKTAASVWNNKDVDGMMNSVFRGAAASAGLLVGEIAKVGFALYGIKEIIGVLQAAWGGFFRETIGREVELRDTILRTRASLASTNKVFVNGKEITDPYEKILKLAGPVEQAINSITERSIELAGVTSGEVINMFNMVAANIGKVGGTLKDAEDLAFAFAAGMGTLGMPGYMAPQEINSILGGYIDRNSRLAQALQISNDDIEKSRGKDGGVVKFLKDRLEAVVAGQKIAAQGFTGVLSNIRDLYELTAGNFGAGLLDPLLAGLSLIFERLNGIRDQIFKIAKGAGTAISSLGAILGGMFTRGRSIELSDGFGLRKSILDQGQRETGNEQYRKDTLNYFDSLGNKLKSSIQNAFVELGKAFKKFEPTLLILGDAMRSLVMSFADIKVGTLNALVAALAAVAEVVSRLSPAIAALINMWARLLNTPLVKYFYEVTTTLKVLKAAGGDILIQGFLIVRFILSALGPAIAKLVQGGLTLIGVFQAITAAVASFTASIGATVSGLGDALADLLPKDSKGPQQIKEAGNNISLLGAELDKTGKKLDGAKGKLQGLGAGMKALGLNTALFMGKLFLVQLAIAAVVDAIGKYQKAQEDKRSLEEAGRALGSLQRNYQGLTRSLTAAEQADKSFKESLVNTEYDKAISKIRELKSEINDLTYEMSKPGIQTWGEFWRSFLVNPDRPGSTSVDEITKREIERRRQEERALRPFVDSVNRDRDGAKAREDIQLANENRVNLEKEIGDLRRQIENDIFAKRQEALRAEVNLFRTQAELRMQSADRLNKKMLDDDQGRAKKGLEAVNNYLQTKMKGEVDIESAQREAQIEAAAIEQEIANYRIEIERKISEIRTRTQQNEIKAAEAAARARTAENPLNTGDAYDTGLRTGPAGSIGAGAAYHQDLEFGSGLDLRQRRQLMVALAKKYDEMGKEIVLSNAAVAGRRFPLRGTAEEQNQWIIDAQNAHYNRPGGSRRRAIDFYTPDKGQSIHGSSVEGTAMYAPSVPGADVTYAKGGGYGNHLQVTKDGKLIYKLGHGDQRRALPSNRKSPGNATPYTPSTAPAPVIENPAAQLPNADNVSARLAAQMRRAQAANNRARAIRAQIIQANTQAALEDLGKSLFTPVDLAEFNNQLINIQEETKLLGQITADTYDPDKLTVISDMAAKSKIANLALQDLEAKLPSITDPATQKPLDQKQQDAIKKSFKNWYTNYIESIEKAADEGLKVVDAERTRDLTRSVKENIRMLPFEQRRQQVQASFGLAQAYDPTNTTRSRLLEAELAILQKKIDLEQQFGPLNEAQLALLEEELEARKQNATEMAKFDEAIQKVATQLELARGAAQAITDSHKQLAQDILSGNDPSEAMTNALQGMSSKVMGMLLDQAFKPMEEQMFKAIRDVFKIKDPAELAREEAIKTAELANKPLIESQTSLKTSIDTLNTTLQTASGLTPNGSADTNPSPTTGVGAIPLTVVPFGGDSTSSVEKAEGAYCDALDKATYTKNQESEQAQQTGAKQIDFGKALAGATQAFGAIAMGIGGAQQMGKGGTYNTLMGLAGIFGALGSITGMFGTGGIFAPKLPGKASGGPVKANRPYIVGEIGPELFMPKGDGEVLSNAKSRKLLSAQALAGKTQTFSTNVNSRRQATPSQVQFDFAYQSEVINNVEYVTSEQFRKGMADSAERGKNMAFAAMQNNISTRRRLGL